VDEIQFPDASRIAIGIDDTERTAKAVEGAVGKRLTYRGTRQAARG
jgi:hypothetical protein